MGYDAVVFYSYIPWAISFDEDAVRMFELLGGKIYSYADSKWNIQDLEFVKTNCGRIRDACGSMVCICS